MGNAQQGINKVNFDDIKKVKSNDHVLINTLNANRQFCLIENTIDQTI